MSRFRNRISYIHSFSSMQWNQSSPEALDDQVLAADGLQGQMVDNKQRSHFKEAAQTMIRTCQARKGVILNSHFLSKKYDMERRRFYDIINVLDAIDLCKKIDSDSFIWKGNEYARLKVKEMAVFRGVYDSSKSLEEIFPSKKCISITQISIDLLLMFLALQTRTLDLKVLSYFLSPTNGREKTMICKLYQSAAIFELVGILEKTKNSGEFKISEEFYYPFNEDPTFIPALLNKPCGTSEFLSKRVHDFAYTHSKKKKVTHKKRVYSYYDDDDDD